jgi:hypothetical protein
VVLAALQEGRDEDLVVNAAIAGAALGGLLGGFGAALHGISQSRLNRLHLSMVEDLTAGEVFARMPESEKFTVEELRAITRAADVPRGTFREVAEAGSLVEPVIERVRGNSRSTAELLEHEQSWLRRALSKWGLSPGARQTFATSDVTAEYAQSLLPTPFLRRGGRVAAASRIQGHSEVAMGVAYELKRIRGRMDARDFSRGVANVIRTGETEGVAKEILEGAGVIKGYFATWEEALRKEGILQGKVELGKDAGYFTRAYKHDEIRARRSDFVRLIAPHVGGIDSANRITDELIAHGSMALNLDGLNFTGAVGQLRARGLLNVPSKVIEDFLFDDLDFILERYARMVGSQYEVAKLQKTGTITDRLNQTEWLGDVKTRTGGVINEDYDRLIAAAKNDKQRNRLIAEKKKAIDELEYVRQSLLGFLTRDPFESGARAVSNAATTASSIAYLGNAGFMSLNDAMAPVFVNGAKSYFRVAASRMARSLRKLVDSGEIEAKELARQSFLYQWIGAEHSRSGMWFDFLGDHADVPRARGGLLRRTHNTFMIANLLRPVTALASEHSTYVAMDALLRASRQLADGVGISKTQRNNLLLSGLDEATAAEIGREVKAGGAVEVEAGALMPVLSRWSDQELAETFRAALIQNTRRAVLNPLKGEVPIIFNNPLGRILFQFLSWPLQATQSYMISGLQRRDAAAMLGMLMMTGVGMFQVATNAVSRGEEVPPLGDLVAEGMDRAGVIGVFSNANHLASRLSGGVFDINRLFLARTAAERFGPIEEAGDVIPAFGLVERMSRFARTSYKLVNGENVSDQQIEAWARRIPLLNGVHMAPIREIVEETVKP